MEHFTREWDSSGKAYCLPDVLTCQDYIDAVTMLVRSGAFPVQGGELRCLTLAKRPEDAAMVQAMDELVAAVPRLVQKHDESEQVVSFSLTVEGSMRAATLDIRSPRPAAMIFALPDRWPPVEAASVCQSDRVSHMLCCAF